MSIPILEQLLGLPHLTITGHELSNATTVILDITPTLKVARLSTHAVRGASVFP